MFTPRPSNSPFVFNYHPPHDAIKLNAQPFFFSIRSDTGVRRVASDLLGVEKRCERAFTDTGNPPVVRHNEFWPRRTANFEAGIMAHAVWLQAEGATPFFNWEVWATSRV